MQPLRLRPLSERLHIAEFSRTTTLARWATVHRLKRNLWRDPAKRGLHVTAAGPTSMATTEKPGRAARWFRALKRRRINAAPRTVP